MADVYEAKPDARQAPEGSELKPTRFRPRYRQLTDDEKQLHDDLKRTAELLETLIERTPKGRYQSLALTALEESIMWAVKGLTA